MLATTIQTQEPGPCHYLEGKTARMEVFFGNELNSAELEHFLESGWRKFGRVYFRPKCQGCRACIPLRVDAQQFKPSKSQKKVLRLNAHTEVQFVDLKFRPEILEVLREHSLIKFGRETPESEVQDSFYNKSCPGFQSEYYVDGKLAGVGFLDMARRGLSSVYFAYRPRYSHLSLGHFSALSEIEYARSLGLEYYYLGYWIADNAHMNYKNRYLPHEIFDWKAEDWVVVKPQ